MRRFLVQIFTMSIKWQHYRIAVSCKRKNSNTEKDTYVSDERQEKDALSSMY